MNKKLLAVTFAITTGCWLQLAVSGNANTAHAQSNRVVKQVACPRAIKVSVPENTGDWEVDARDATYSSVKVAKRKLGNQTHYTAVCYYTAFNAKVPIERELGAVQQFSRCEVATVSGRGGVKCYE